MNLIFIYGPPATGKLTVAQALSRLTGYAVFHNHLTRDMVQSIYSENISDHYDLVDTLREDVLGYCAQHDTSLIFTMVYDGSSDDEVVIKRVNTVLDNGGKVLFVELTAPDDVLLNRIGSDSRKSHRKLTDPNELLKLLKTIQFSSLPYDHILKIDTSEHTPEESARIIVDHFDLSKI